MTSTLSEEEETGRCVSPQQTEPGFEERPFMDVGLSSEAFPASFWKNAQSQRGKNDLAFKAFIWSSGTWS